MPAVVDPYAELRALKSICDGPEDVKNYLLSRLVLEHFASPYGSGPWRRIDALVREGKPVPGLGTLSVDPILSEEEKAFIAEDEAVGTVSSVDEAQHLLTILEDLRRHRLLYQGIKGALETIHDKEEFTPATDIVDNLDGVLDQVRESPFSESPVIYVGTERSDQLIANILTNDPPPKVQTGLKVFDDAAGGFARKNVVTLAANTGGGKTVFCIQMAKNMAELGFKAGLVGFEMDYEEYAGRMLSCVSGVPYKKVDLHTLSAFEMRTAFQEWEAYKERVEEAGGSHGLACPEAMDPRQIDFTFRDADLDVIFVDYIGLVSGYEKKQREERLSDLTRDFKVLAKRLNCVVILLAQMDEESQQVKYSKAIRHHSSFVWKWDFYNDEDLPDDQFIYVQQEKARNTTPFNFYVKAEFNSMRIRDPDPENDPNKTEPSEYKPQQEEKKEPKKQQPKKQAKSNKTRRSYDRSKFAKPKKKRRLQDLNINQDLPAEMDDL